MKNAIALAAVAMTSPAACNANKRVGDMEATRNRPVAHLTEAAIRNHEELFPGYRSKVKETCNLNVGNDKEKLIAVVTQLLPYIGYPRALSALNCVNEVIPEGQR